MHAAGRREAQAAAKLEHPNVCPVYEVGEHQGQVYFAMQYIEGETLAQRIARGPLDIETALLIAEQVADALAEAHARGIIHRDIKPQNVILSTRGTAKVLDFGLAKAVSESAGADSETVGVLTEAGAIPGTTAYMPPEQLRGERLDPRTDVFSFGCVLDEIVSGRRAFKKENAAATIAAILSGSRPGLDPRLVPPELHRIIAKCLETDRDRRYQSARDLVVDIRNLRRDVGPLASRAAEKRPARRLSPSAYWSGLAIAVVVLIVTAGWMWSRRHASSPAAGTSTVLAILPFVSADPSTQYLGDGISLDLINSLSQLPQLRVIARTTTLRYNGDRVDVPALRRDLGVDVVVTGRVLLQNDMLVVQADLTNALDGSQIWGDRYNKRLSDIFAAQEEIARDIAGKLRLRLSTRDAAGLSRRYTSNIDAYRHYLQGRSYAQRRTPADLKESIAHYERAIALDRSYALAYTGLVDAYINLTNRGFIALSEGRRRAREAATTALELDAELRRHTRPLARSISSPRRMTSRPRKRSCGAPLNSARARPSPTSIWEWR